LIRSARFLAVSLVCVAALSVSAQAWKGMARIQGTILDEAGEPIKGASVTLKSVRDGGGPPAILTDARGRWAALGLSGGAWDLDVVTDGYLKKSTRVQLSELDRLPPMKIQLEAAPPPEPAQAAAPEETREAIQVGGVEISPETANALEAANTFMREQKWKEAAAEYEKAIAVLSTNTSLKFALARAYYGGGEIAKAIVQVREIHTGDPGNITAATLLADMLLESGKVDEAKTVLAAVPAGAITDVNTLINLGIRFTNQNRSQEALTYFNEAVGVAPDVAATFYYRGLAHLQLKKMAEAKADLKKVIEMGPEAPEAKDARELLAQMK